MSYRRGDVVRAYRHLYQAGLRAVQFSPPARHVIRTRLRDAFRRGNPGDFDARRVRNTVTFLRNACEPRSLEARVLRSILHSWWHRSKHLRDRQRRSVKMPQNLSEHARHRQNIEASAYDHFDHLIKMLNESMGLCIR